MNFERVWQHRLPVLFILALLWSVDATAQSCPAASLAVPTAGNFDSNLQNTINSAALTSHKTVCIPCGTYTIAGSSTINIAASNMRIMSMNRCAVLNIGSNLDAALFSTGTNTGTRFDGFAINGAGNSQPHMYAFQISANNTEVENLQITTVPIAMRVATPSTPLSGLKVQGSTIENTKGYSFFIYNLSNFRFSGNIVRNWFTAFTPGNYGDAINYDLPLGNVSNWTVDSNLFEGGAGSMHSVSQGPTSYTNLIEGADFSNNIGIAHPSSQERQGVGFGIECNGCTIAGNRFRGTAISGWRNCIEAYGRRNVTIKNNVCESGAIAAGVPASGDSIIGLSITDNKIITQGTTAGMVSSCIVVGGWAGASGSAVTTEADDVKVLRNYCEARNAPSTNGVIGIDVANSTWKSAQRMEISNNTVLQSAQFAIRVYGPQDYLKATISQNCAPQGLRLWTRIPANDVIDVTRNSFTAQASISYHPSTWGGTISSSDNAFTGVPATPNTASCTPPPVPAPIVPGGSFPPY